MKYIQIIAILMVFVFSFSNNELNTSSKKIHTFEKMQVNKLNSNFPDHLNLDFIMGKFDPSNHDRFVRIEDKYTNKKNIYLDHKAYKAFLRMYRDAYKEGFRLVIISATRNFEYQKRIWDNKWSNLPDTLSEKEKVIKILEYSSMPGSSRHHWGTEMDLNVLDNRYYEEGEGKKIYDWLKSNAHKYGFCKPYTEGRDKGYNEERWHWSYKPLASVYLKYALENMKDELISGFNGADFASELKITQNYIMCVSDECF